MRTMDLFGDKKPALPDGALPYREFRRDELLPLSTVSSSKGNQRKYKTLDGRYYVKECFVYQERVWKDNLVEVVASQYATMCSLPPGVSVVRQGLCKIGTEQGSYSEAFDLDDQVYVSYNRAYKTLFGKECVSTGTPEELFEEIVRNCSTILQTDARSCIVNMMLLDAIIANEDRHLNNFGFLQSASGAQVFAPLFDFGLGMYEGDIAYKRHHRRGELKDIMLKPCWFKVSTLIDFLLDSCGQYWKDTLPSQVDCGVFQFPSALAKKHFIYANERLGVKVYG